MSLGFQTLPGLGTTEPASSSILGSCLHPSGEIRVISCTQPLSLGLWELAPLEFCNALKQPDLTPQEGPVALATETDPSCAPGAAGGFPASEAALLVLVFPGVCGVGGEGAPCPSPAFPSRASLSRA